LRVALQATYEREAAERAEKHHGCSDFSAPARHTLDEAAARQIMKAFFALRDFLWRNRGRATHTG
jgi:hypothetical protein